MSSTFPPGPGLSQRLTLIIQGLRGVSAARAARDRRAVATVLLLWPYLNRLMARMEALITRWQSGRIRPAPARPAAARPAAERSLPSPPHLPRGFGWLLRMVPETAAIRGQLHHLLSDPELAALLEAAPQAGRLLRPLCRMLRIGPDPDMPPALLPPDGGPRRRSPPQSRPEEAARTQDAGLPAGCVTPPSVRSNSFQPRLDPHWKPQTSSVCPDFSPPKVWGGVGGGGREYPPVDTIRVGCRTLRATAAAWLAHFVTMSNLMRHDIDTGRLARGTLTSRTPAAVTLGEWTSMRP